MKTLNDFFDHIYCINLAYRKDRWNKVSEEFQKHNLNVERVEAVYGKTLKNLTNLADGAYGIILSNLLIFKDSLKKGYEKILILEDDIYFIDAIHEKFWNKIEFLPSNWDLLYLGGNTVFEFGWYEMISGRKDISINRNTYNKLDYDLIKTGWTQCAYSIGYNTKIFPDLIQILEKFEEPIDVTLPKLSNTQFYNSYIFFPTLARTYDNYSDIENRITDYVDNIGVNY